MATLNVWTHLSLSTQGSEFTAKQGAITDDPAEPFAITVDGSHQGLVGQITTATVSKIWETSTLLATPFDYLHFWADQTTYLQLISASANAVFKVLAKTPFVLPGFGSFVAAGNTTVITGGTEPTPVALASLYVGNYSGSTANYQLSIVS